MSTTEPAPHNADLEAENAPYYLDNPKAVGAPANSRWGYLPCGCSHNGHGGHNR